MAPDDPDTLGELLEQALALSPEARPGFIRDMCAGDERLRDEITSLIAAHDAEAGYFEQLSDRIVVPALLTLSGDAVGELRVGDTVAHYRLLEELGGGGMGVVFKALDLRLNRFVALKFLPAHLSTAPDAKARLVVEASATSALDHPNIGVVHDIAETNNGRLFMVMAYYDGETLERKNEGGGIAVGEALDITRQIAEALTAAHQKGITHRDVKPSNILVTREGTAKLLDFGIAEVADSRQTQDAAMRGTIAYMSPEQTRGSLLDRRTDLWSLGVVLYEMIAGIRPFRGVTEEGVIDAIRHDDWEPVDRLKPGIPAGVCRILARCLAKDPGDRYETAQQLLTDLETMPDDSAVASARRGRLFAYVSAAALVGLIAGGTVYLNRGTPPPPRSTAFAGAHHTRLAVIPLTGLGSDPEESYLADAMTSELIAQLSTFGSLRVIARSSVIGYQNTGKGPVEIGRELAAGTVLDGALRKTGDKIEVTVRLIDVSTQEQFWNEAFEARVEELQGVPQRIARQAAEVLQVRIAPAERRQLAIAGTSNPDAYLLYLRGRHLLDKWDAASARQAKTFFEQALDLDPAFARAWTALGDAYHVLGGLATLPAADAYPRTRAAAQRALEIDPNLPAGHVSLATALSAYYWDFEAAAQHIRRAIALNPSDATAHNLYSEYLRYQGRFDEALEEIRQAEELDPLAPVHQIDAGIVLYLARRYDQAIAKYRRLLSMKPDHTYTYFPLALAYAQAGQYEQALSALDQAGSAGRLQVQQHTLRGYIHGRRARHENARTELARLTLLSSRQHVSPWHFAIVHLGLEDHERALDLLEQAYSDRAWQLRLLPVEPMFDSIRSQPRFRALTAKVR